MSRSKGSRMNYRLIFLFIHLLMKLLFLRVKQIFAKERWWGGGGCLSSFLVLSYLNKHAWCPSIFTRIHKYECSSFSTPFHVISCDENWLAHCARLTCLGLGISVLFVLSFCLYCFVHSNDSRILLLRCGQVVDLFRSVRGGLFSLYPLSHHHPSLTWPPSLKCSCIFSNSWPLLHHYFLISQYFLSWRF